MATQLRGITYHHYGKAKKPVVTVDLNMHGDNSAFEDFLDGMEAESAKTTVGRSWDLAMAHLDKIHGVK